MVPKIQSYSEWHLYSHGHLNGIVSNTQQHRHCMYNGTSRHILATIFALEKR